MVIRFYKDKKNVDFIRLRYLRYRQTPCKHIRVKAHAEPT